MCTELCPCDSTTAKAVWDALDATAFDGYDRVLAYSDLTADE